MTTQEIIERLRNFDPLGKIMEELVIVAADRLEELQRLNDSMQADRDLWIKVGREKLEVAAKERDEARAEVERLNEALSDYRAANSPVGSGLRLQIGQLKTEVERLTKEFAAANSEIERLTKQNDDIRADVSELIQERNDAREYSTNLSNDLYHAKTEVARLQEENRICRETSEQVSKAFLHERATRQQLETELNLAIKQRDEARAEVERLKYQLGEHTEMVRPEPSRLEIAAMLLAHGWADRSVERDAQLTGWALAAAEKLIAAAREGGK